MITAETLARLTGSAVPTLSIVTTPGIPTKYGIANWHEVDLWGNRMDPTWHAITDRCRWGGIQDEERMKILCAELLRQKTEAQKQLLEYAARYGVMHPQSDPSSTTRRNKP